jgi:hypothetical protein
MPVPSRHRMETRTYGKANDYNFACRIVNVNSCVSVADVVKILVQWARDGKPYDVACMQLSLCFLSIDLAGERSHVVKRAGGSVPSHWHGTVEH